ncbi:MAG TPA: 3D domain-containing protein [Blastocatellia bacterium]|nr:3D domain-containing protein [Blastocatellia bacterium]
MNQSPNRRFSRGLSGLTILTFFVVGYSISGNTITATAADNPSAASQSSQVDFLDIPGTFKNLPRAKDTVTAKRPVEEINLNANGQSTNAQLEIDATKGIAINLAKGAANNLTDERDLQDFHATAYCLKGRTASGEYVRPGVIAADPRVLPLGTVVHIRAGRFTGTYTVFDTGARIKGRVVDVYVPSRRDAVEFGRRQVKIKVLGRLTRSGDPSRKNTIESDL